MKAISINKNPQTEADIRIQAELKASGEIPRHIAIIMDGNGRWAKNHGNIRIYGHKAGVDSVRDITEACAQIGVKYLTLYAFSTENWSRPTSEISGLMQILIQTLRRETKRLNENNIKLSAIGQIERFPERCKRELNEAMELTDKNERMQLCLALSYSGRWDITQAVRRIAGEVKKGNIDPDEIDTSMVSKHLSTANVPDPDLIIRTSGEYRISNFLLWQLAYSEFYITERYWPDFRRNELYSAIKSYQKRERRFGKISEQLHDGGFQVG